MLRPEHFPDDLGRAPRGPRWRDAFADAGGPAAPALADWSAKTTTFPELLETVELHDGSWRGLSLNPLDNSLYLWIEPYAAWNSPMPRDERRKGMRCGSWLGVWVERVWVLECHRHEGCGSIIGAACSRPVDEAERLSWIEHPTGLVSEEILAEAVFGSLHLTKIEDVGAGFVRIAHAPEIRVCWPAPV